MNKATSAMIAAGIALTLSGGAYAQSNNTLATPTTRSPAATATTTGYGSTGVTKSDSGVGAMNAGQPKSMGMTQTSVAPAFGSNNTLATPSTKSPAAQ